MPLGIGTWSGGVCAQNSWHCGNGVSPVPPHPGPLPRGEGELSAAWRHSEASRYLARRPTEHPLLGQKERPSPTLAYLAHPQARSAASDAPSPWGEGWGEGERGRRTDAAAQNVFGPREIEPQFLAALERRSAPPSDLSSYDRERKFNHKPHVISGASGYTAPMQEAAGG